jgi:ethanolamine utilization protein EutQ (cupin superfamily)
MSVHSIRLIESSSIQAQSRGGAADGVAEISWAIPDNEGAKLPCGFGRWHDAVCEPKTLTYDEVILVLEGTFGVESSDGTRVEGRPGDVIELRKGTTIKYFGSRARLFFVTH